MTLVCLSWRAIKQALLAMLPFSIARRFFFPDFRRRRPRFEFPGSAGAGPRQTSRSAQKMEIPEAGWRFLTALCQHCKDIPRF